MDIAGQDQTDSRPEELELSLSDATFVRSG